MLTRPVSATPIEALKTTPRVERLRRTLLETPKTETDEIPRLAHRAYEEHPEAPAILKRAHAFAAILDQMTLYVRPEELLVGNPTPMLCAQNRVPSEWFEA